MSRKTTSLACFTASALGLALCFGVGPAAAEDAAPSDNASKAKALFAEGRKLVQDGNYEQACGKFEESLRLNVGIGTQFNLADCWEHTGRSASAQSLFLGAAASAHAAGQTEREQVAKARADALEPRLLHLLIDVRATDPELTIRRNAIEIKRESWGAAVPVDPGTYLIEASAPGKKTWSARVSVPASASAAISITVPPLEDPAVACDKPAGAAPAESVAPAEKKAEKPVAPPPLTDGNERSTRRTAYSVALAGVGVVSLGVGTVLALEYKSKNDDARAICPSGVGCSGADIDRHSSLVSDAKTFRTWSFVGFGVGGAAVIGAAVLYFAPSSQRASGFVATPFVTADGTWGAVASGKF